MVLVISIIYRQESLKESWACSVRSVREDVKARYIHTSQSINSGTMRSTTLSSEITEGPHQPYSSFCFLCSLCPAKCAVLAICEAEWNYSVRGAKQVSCELIPMLWSLRCNGIHEFLRKYQRRNCSIIHSSSTQIKPIRMFIQMCGFYRKPLFKWAKNIFELAIEMCAHAALHEFSHHHFHHHHHHQAVACFGFIISLPVVPDLSSLLVDNSKQSFSFHSL